MDKIIHSYSNFRLHGSYIVLYISSSVEIIKHYSDFNFYLTCYIQFIYFFLGATTGGISYIINAIRSFLLKQQVGLWQKQKMCIIICFMQVAVLILTWVRWIGILPVLQQM